MFKESEDKKERRGREKEKGREREEKERRERGKKDTIQAVERLELRYWNDTCGEGGDGSHDDDDDEDGGVKNRNYKRGEKDEDVVSMREWGQERKMEGRVM